METNNKFVPLINKTINFLVLILAFSLPVFFLPITTEFFEFNKIALASGITMALLVLWAAKIISKKEASIVVGPVNTPILLLFLAVAVSTYFSISLNTSIYGSYGRWNNSFIIVTLGSILYYIVSSNIKNRNTINNIITAFIVGTTISSAIMILSYFGIYVIRADFAQFNNFSITGSPLTATILAAIASILALANILGATNYKMKVFYAFVAVLNFIPIALINILATWVLFIFGISYLLYKIGTEILNSSVTVLSAVAGMIILLSLIFAIPGIKKALNIPTNYTQTNILDNKTSWIITAATLRDFPLFGSGPSTYYLNFSHYRPLYLNSTNMWDIKLDKPSSEYMDVLSTLGILGFAIYLYLIKQTYNLTQIKDNNPLHHGISAAILALFVTYLFTYSTALTNTIMFFLLALLTSYNEKTLIYEATNKEPTVEKSILTIIANEKNNPQLVAYLVAVFALTVAGTGTYFGYKTYAAEFFMRKAIIAANQNKAEELFSYQQQSLKLNPNIDFYHTAASQTSMAIANNITQSVGADKLTEEQKQAIQSLISNAIAESRITTELLNTTDPLAWEQRANLYSQLMPISEDAGNFAVTSYTRAIELDPTNPMLRLKLGGLYYSAKNFAIAEKHFAAAISLKPDYANAHYNRAYALKELKSYQEALREFQIVQKLVAPESEESKKVVAEIETLNNMPEVAGAQDKISLEDLNKTTPTTKQNPLTTPIIDEVKESTTSIK